jgi:hypothetical protein
MHRAVRLAASALLAIGMAWVPVTTAVACSCAFAELPQAIAEADVAIVGRIVAEQQGPADGTRPAILTWKVERSRDALDVDELPIAAWPDNGANCGMSFDADERWLVLAYRSDDGLETNGCMRNVPLDRAAPDDVAVVTEMIGATATSSPADNGVSVPAPLLIGGVTLVVLGLVSFVAFRRSSGGAG